MEIGVGDPFQPCDHGSVRMDFSKLRDNVGIKEVQLMDPLLDVVAPTRVRAIRCRSDRGLSGAKP